MTASDAPAIPDGVEIAAPDDQRYPEVLTPEALAFVAALQREFGGRRRELLDRRAERQAEIDAGAELDFLPETREVREGSWQVSPPADRLQDRRVEITGPTDAKMVINALNSGASGFMADFEDSNTPSWGNMMQGQVNLTDAIAGTLSFRNPDGKEYALAERTATLLVRARGWHLVDKHVLVDGAPVSGALLDFGLYFWRNARTLVDRGFGVFLYLPKMQSHLEARLWNDVFTYAEDALELPRGTVRATVLIETLPAAFEMEEILYELREHSAGLNAGRWDYLFSAIKTFRTRKDKVLPDRNSITMTVPFMRAYTELLVATCHRRGAHAMGGMAAFIPSRRDPELNERAMAKVRADKEREAGNGFDGTWVAHPDLVPVAREVFDAVLGDRPNQLDKQRDDVRVTAADLVAIDSADGEPTREGLRNDVRVGIRYIASWLRGNGAAGIDNLMEDAATAEIARCQVWQWVHHGVVLSDGTPVTADLVRSMAADELDEIRAEVGEDAFAGTRAEEARQVFEQVALSEELPDFLTLPAYELID